MMKGARLVRIQARLLEQILVPIKIETSGVKPAL